MKSSNTFLKILILLALVPFYWGAHSACTGLTGGSGSGTAGSIGGSESPLLGVGGNTNPANPAEPPPPGGGDSGCVGPSCQPTGTVIPGPPPGRFFMTAKLTEAPTNVTHGQGTSGDTKGGTQEGSARKKKNDTFDPNNGEVEPPPELPRAVVTVNTTSPSKTYTFSVNPEEEKFIDFEYEVEWDFLGSINRTCITDIEVSAKMENPPPGRTIATDIYKGRCPTNGEDLSCRVVLALKNFPTGTFPEVKDLQCEWKKQFPGEIVSEGLEKAVAE